MTLYLRRKGRRNRMLSNLKAKLVPGPKLVAKKERGLAHVGVFKGSAEVGGEF